MSYEKQTWETGDVVTAEKLNYMESGIGNSVLAVNIQGDIEGEEPLVLDKTWQEIYDSTYAIAIYDDSGYNIFYPITEIIPGGEYEGTTYPYGVIFGNMHTVLEFKADSADDYPTREVPK